MFVTRGNLLFNICVVLAFFKFNKVKAETNGTNGTNGINGTNAVDVDGTVKDVTSIVQSPLTKAMCKLKTNELFEFYNYTSETHYITTEDGYILTVFRCISKKNVTEKKGPVIVAHGILGSSDDFSTNIPEQALVYVLVNAGYDVWAPNFRGNYYSKNHTTKSPLDPSFWDFSYYEIAVKDYPAVIDYVRAETGYSQVYFVGHSQGTTCFMTMLSELPIYNGYVKAGSLLAPVSYLNNSDFLFQTLGKVVPILEPLRASEIFARDITSGVLGTVCDASMVLDREDLIGFCDRFLDALTGQSDDQRNASMQGAFMCHYPSGCSVKQLLHFGKEINKGFFGKYMTGLEIPPDYKLARITTPIIAHFSPVDKFTNTKDVERLVPQLTSLEYLQVMNKTAFNHVDFIWGIHAADEVYSKILEFFEKH